jgi:polysaccharide deacetylase 2 family uncharacterized protein YibQ
MAELKLRGLYFVDSRTSPQTKALTMAEKIQLPSRKRDVFLDDERTRSNIRYQLLRALELAQQQGSAIAIGHPYPETLNELEQLQPLLNQYKVQLVKASQLMLPSGRYQQMGDQSNTTCIAPPINLWPQIWVPIDPFSLDLVLMP